MSNPAMPNLPGFGAIADTMELVRTMWGGVNTPGIGMPGMVMPTLSVEDINKQISDLKAVESWLTLNMNMLRGTIQALEVQSATISTLKSMGETLSASVKQATPAPAPMGSGFAFPFGAAAATPPAAPATASAFAGGASFAATPDTSAAQEAPAPASEASLANPAGWWSMLQDQFKHAVDTAMAAEPVAAPPVPGNKPAASAGTAKPAVKKPAAKRVRKPAAKSPAR